jgi:hypothetical protein
MGAFRALPIQPVSAAVLKAPGIPWDTTIRFAIVPRQWEKSGLVLALLLLFARPVAAQPADCPPAPATGPIMPLAIDMAGRPGVPKGTSGQAYIDLPVGAPAGTACHDDPPKPPQDVLRGEPGDVLGGPPSPDLLRGPGSPRIEIEIR